MTCKNYKRYGLMHLLIRDKVFGYIFAVSDPFCRPNGGYGEVR